MRRILVTLCALGVALLPACGGGDGEGGGGPAEALGLVQTAGATTRSEGTARVAMSVKAPAGEGPELMTVKGEGVFELEGQRGSLTMELPRDLTGPGAPVEIDMAFEGTKVFMRIPEGESFPGVDTDWVSFDLAGIDESVTGTDLTQMAGSNNDPTQALAMLEGIADDVEEVGEDDVRGEPTTHFQATVDIRQAIEKSGAVTDPAQFERFVEGLGEDEIEMDVWIDGEGRVRRLQFEQPLPDDERTATMTMELYDFATDEQPEIPEAADVTDVTDMISQQVEGGGGGQEPPAG